MKARRLIYIIFSIFILTGCSASSYDATEESKNTWDESGYVEIGDIITVEKSDDRMKLSDNKMTLASDGLFYCAWTIGNSEPYENDEGDIVDLYDAQIYLLLGKFAGAEKAQENVDDWLSSARSNYEITTEGEIICNSQTYTLITYNYINDGNPYVRGASAFGVHGSNAVCIELACRDTFADDPESILENFLNNCTYNNN